ncbi:hypothetical protein G5I_12427 [Acromyrmex echinatior]|uniref:Uncharacterized protein n=1 Tax=Acromyrmex echinatior TaxID=103372 RepID=F4X2A5_ACREC|nr:hypothetical protein G5I_12427 [Acromyrmex echinatior]
MIDILNIIGEPIFDDRIVKIETYTYNLSCASWLSVYHHGLRWEDGMIPYSDMKRLITTAVFKDDAIIKGREERTWLWNLFLDDKRKHILQQEAAKTDQRMSDGLEVTMNIRNDNELMGKMNFKPIVESLKQIVENIANNESQPIKKEVNVVKDKNIKKRKPENNEDVHDEDNNDDDGFG